MERNSFRTIVLVLSVWGTLWPQAAGLPQLRVVDTPQKLTNEFVGATHRTSNDAVAAGIKIVSDLTGLTYQANNGVVGRVEHNPGSDLVFLQPGERVVIIYKSGYEPLKIILAGRGIHLRSREIWELKITAEKKPIYINIISDPADAEKFIDGDSLGKGRNFKVIPGERTLRVSKEGYRPVEKTIVVSESKTLFDEIVLTQIDVVPVTINTTPDKADLYINGTIRGKTNWSDFLLPGSYDLRLIREGYFEKDTGITVKEKSQNQFQFKLIKNSATLAVSVTPVDAAVMLNNQPASTGIQELVPGNYKLTVLRSGYLSHSEDLLLKAGDKIDRSVNLEKNTGNLNLVTRPESADLILNKHNYHQKRNIEIAPGNYRLELQKEGWFPFSENIVIVRGDTARRRVELKPKTGELQLVVEPPVAQAELRTEQGKQYQTWNGLKLLKGVPVGNYKLQVSFPGFLTASKSLRIEYNQRKAVSVKLLTYTGSLQQRIDHYKKIRNYNLAGTLVLAIAAGGLQAYSRSVYADYTAAATTSEAGTLYNRANNLNKLSGIFGTGAGASTLPLIYWQVNLKKLAESLKK